jgi:hypothetical protein
MKDTHADAVRLLMAHAIMYRDVDEPMFVWVEFADVTKSRFIVTARYPHESEPKSMLSDLVKMVNWNIAIDRQHNCWSVYFRADGKRMSKDDCEVFRGWCKR